MKNNINNTNNMNKVKVPINKNLRSNKRNIPLLKIILFTFLLILLFFILKCIFFNTNNKIICKRVTDVNVSSLHTEKCVNNINFCASDGYTSDNSTITYGTIWDGESTLNAGNAFDCDVNDDGIYDKETERFYYVSDYYDTEKKEFDLDTAVLIYYKNTIDGKANSKGASYNKNIKTYKGPETALTHLPTNKEWSNVNLKENTRAILAESNNLHDLSIANEILLPEADSNHPSFDYKNSVARLITMQEIKKGCRLSQINSDSTSKLSKYCNFLFEDTKYANNNNLTYGPWFETLEGRSQNYVWYANSSNRSINYYSAKGTINDVRPVIEVSKDNIS